MGWFVFVLLLAGAIWAYFTLTEMEKEIRAELASDEPEPVPSREQDNKISNAGKADDSDSLESRICSFVNRSSGVLQTELYKYFPGIDKKIIQKALLDLDRSGKISRTKSGSTYKIS